MKLVTRESRASIAAKQWRVAFYSYSNKWPSRHFAETYDKLVGLGKNPSPSSVDTVMGNTDWTQVVCDECKSSVILAIEYEGPLWICKTCLLESLEKIKCQST